jgi:excisionase family DNA binding protein
MKDQKSAAQFSESPDTKPLWTIDDVARYARCSIRHVTTLREKGLPFRKLGHLVRFNPETVKRWFED